MLDYSLSIKDIYFNALFQDTSLGLGKRFMSMTLALTITYSKEEDAKRLSICERLGLGSFLLIPAKYLEYASVCEIVDPLLEYRVEIRGISIYHMPLTSIDMLEKAAIIADEIDARYVITHIRDNNLYYMKKDIMKNIFDIFSSYKIGFCVESYPEIVPKLRNIVQREIGGVIWLAVAPSENTDTHTLIKIILNNIRLIKVIKAINFANNKPEIVTKGRNINYYSVIKALVRNYFYGDFVLDYDPYGLQLDLTVLSREIETIRQYMTTATRRP